jgi:hypothetical protein
MIQIFAAVIESVGSVFRWLTLGYWPDKRAHQRVTRMLSERACLDQNDWYNAWWSQLGISEEISHFAYSHFSGYFGVDCGRIAPSDRLFEDLEIHKVGFGDWDFDLYEDFKSEFGVDLRESPDIQRVRTFEDLVRCLHGALNAPAKGELCGG